MNISKIKKFQVSLKLIQKLFNNQQWNLDNLLIQGIPV